VVLVVSPSQFFARDFLLPALVSQLSFVVSLVLSVLCSANETSSFYFLAGGCLISSSALGMTVGELCFVLAFIKV
jgi:hypothetical protein